ncbi:MAG TPA: GTPase, partial [Demequina sp.]|nr:GTPase [Demequina sp.]
MSDDYDDDYQADAEYLKNYVPPAPSDPQESLDEVRQAALRAGLEAYELDERDLATLDGEPTEQREALPILAIVGRPNVGKSTLINRIIGRRLAVVEDTPGVTRDRVTYEAEWAGRDFMLMDTGGWEAGVHGIDLSVAQSAEVAMELADVVLFVVDATVGPTATDEKVVKLLRKTKKPVVLVANKVDGPQGELEAASLLNRLADSERVVVHDVAGTTRSESASRFSSEDLPT